jgi:hypothetical protein
MPVHQALHRQDPGGHPPGHQRPQEHREQPRPGRLSQSDPEPARSTRRPPIWLIIIAVLLVAVVVMHLAGGKGLH